MDSAAKDHALRVGLAERLRFCQGEVDASASQATGPSLHLASAANACSRLQRCLVKEDHRVQLAQSVRRIRHGTKRELQCSAGASGPLWGISFSISKDGCTRNDPSSLFVALCFVYVGTQTSPQDAKPFDKLNVPSTKLRTHHLPHSTFEDEAGEAGNHQPL
eukprot:4056681-Amphidinium_carterae.1